MNVSPPLTRQMRKRRLAAKRVSESAMITYRLMMPTDANIAGNVFGGSIMKYMDEIAGIVASRHPATNVVTASIDRMNFFAPLYIGNLFILKAAGKGGEEVHPVDGSGHPVRCCVAGC